MKVNLYFKKIHEKVATFGKIEIQTLFKLQKKIMQHSIMKEKRIFFFVSHVDLHKTLKRDLERFSNANLC